MANSEESSTVLFYKQYVDENFCLFKSKTEAHFDTIRYDIRYDMITLRYIKPKVLQENEFPIKLIDKSTNKFLCNIDNFFNSDKKGT